VAVLRRTLYLDALLTAVGAVALLAVPRFVVVTLLDQPEPPDFAWHRLTAVAGLGLALVMVLVGHRVEELWWWCWAFVVVEVGSAAVATLHAAFGVPGGAASWPWWAIAGISWLFAGAFLWGIARAGVERPPP
jgi:hypothetical protein